jgi:putative IMPACT (imprinted ancient) family translation regulator
MASNYNGYSNYATWQINNDILSKCDFTEPIEAFELEDIVTTVVFRENEEQRLMQEYAAAFISKVDFEELAYMINKNINL